MTKPFTARTLIAFTQRPSASAFALITALAALTLTACASPKSAEEHRALAAAEEGKAAAHLERYDENASALAMRETRDGHGIIVEEYNPTHWQRVEADAHSRAAERHKDAARALEATEDAACVGTPPAARSACPLLFPTEVADLPRGMRVTFADEDSAARAEAVIRCQQAFAVARAFEDLPTCALYAKNLKLMRAGATLELTTSDEAAVQRLRANIRGHRAR